MKPDEIKLGDWMRMLMGNAPPEFLIEIVIRVVFLFILLVVAMRLLGLRMSAQLNRIDFTGSGYWCAAASAGSGFNTSRIDCGNCCRHWAIGGSVGFP
jgi:hypothetical protein